MTGSKMPPVDEFELERKEIAEEHQELANLINKMLERRTGVTQPRGVIMELARKVYRGIIEAARAAQLIANDRVGRWSFQSNKVNPK